MWYYEIAREALADVEKEGRFSYEDRLAPHQYYYPEDLDVRRAPGRRAPLGRPLEVSRPDVTMRGTRPFGLGLV
jgi:hypothetical protein